jgi:hypothetical protein
MDRPMRTPPPQRRCDDERDQRPCCPERPCCPDRQALIELLAARNEAGQPEADLAWVADRFELRR